MVLPLKGLWLIAAMAIVWFGNCGGMAVMIEYRIALSICTVIFTAIYAISVIIANVLSQGWFDLWRPFSMVLPLLVFCFLSADSTAKLFFICFTQLNVCGFIVISSGLAVSAFANPGPVLIPLLLLMNGGMLWFYVKRLRAPFREIIATIEWRWQAAVLLPAAFSIAFMLLIGLSSALTGVEMALAYAAALVIFTAMCLCYCGIYQNLKQSEALRSSHESETMLRTQLRRQREEMGMFESTRESANRIRHDIRHHSNILLRFLDDNETDKARGYIGGIIKETEVGNIKRWCANYTLNAILSIYAERAEKLGIKVEVEASVPAELKIDEMELASIYANTIENAAEGCAAVAAGTNRWIKIFTAYEGGRLILQVRNSCAPNTVKFDEMGMPISSKVGGGTGTRSIRYVVEKHGGTWFFEEKEGVFSTSVVIAGA